jgi:hypothetical protein
VWSRPEGLIQSFLHSTKGLHDYFSGHLKALRKCISQSRWIGNHLTMEEQAKSFAPIVKWDPSHLSQTTLAVQGICKNDQPINKSVKKWSLRLQIFAPNYLMWNNKLLIVFCPSNTFGKGLTYFWCHFSSTYVVKKS